MRSLPSFQSSLASWLDARPWDYWYTVTYRDSLSRDAVARTQRKLQRDWNPAQHFWACEDGSVTGRHHAHGLLRWDESDHLIQPQATELWSYCFEKWGRSHVDVYEPTVGATGYVAKYVSKEITEWGIQE
jgi:hypothetical protein